MCIQISVISSRLSRVAGEARSKIYRKLKYSGVDVCYISPDDGDSISPGNAVIYRNLSSTADFFVIRFDYARESKCK